MRRGSERCVGGLFNGDFRNYRRGSGDEGRVYVHVINSGSRRRGLSSGRRRALSCEHLGRGVRLVRGGVPARSIVVGSRVRTTAVGGVFHRVLVGSCYVGRTLPRCVVSHFGKYIVACTRGGGGGLCCFMRLAVNGSKSVTCGIKRPQLARSNVVAILKRGFRSRRCRVPTFGGKCGRGFVCYVRGSNVACGVCSAYRFIFPRVRRVRQTLIKLGGVRMPIRMCRSLVSVMRDGRSGMLYGRHVHRCTSGISRSLFCSSVGGLNGRTPPRRGLAQGLVQFMADGCGVGGKRSFEATNHDRRALTTYIGMRC